MNTGKDALALSQIKDMQIIPVMRYYFSYIGMVNIHTKINTFYGIL